MQVVLVIISVVLLGVIINYAFSPKSSRILRLAALGALGLIAISLGIASIIIATSGSNGDTEESHLPIFLDLPQEAPKKSNLIEIIVFLVFLAFVIVMIAVIASRDRKIRQAEAKKAAASPRFSTTEKHEDLDIKAEESHEKAKEDDGFDLDLN